LSSARNRALCIVCAVIPHGLLMLADGSVADAEYALLPGSTAPGYHQTLFGTLTKEK